MKRITLATLAQATEQQIFDQVAVHLLTQGRRSARTQDLSATCMYRDNHGGMCAAGCLISGREMARVRRDHYNTSPWGTIADKFGIAAHAHFISQLQVIHDRSAVHTWLDRLADYALQRGLDISKLKPFEKKYPTVNDAYSDPYGPR